MISSLVLALTADYLSKESLCKAKAGVSPNLAPKNMQGFDNLMATEEIRSSCRRRKAYANILAIRPVSGGMDTDLTDSLATSGTSR